MFVFMRTKVFLTVEGAVAGVIATPPGSVSKPHDSITTLARLLLKTVRCKSRYEAERLREYNEKVTEAVKNALGDDVKEMWYIDGLFTAPSNQGRGYGRALLNAVISQVDDTFHAAWLKSSDQANTAFYNSHGFMVVTEVVLGDQNPTWTGPPVVITIMLRPPRTNGGIRDRGP